MKTLKDYQEEYKRTIRAAMNPNTQLVIKENIWIYFKFTEDNNIAPENLEHFKNVILNTQTYDAELFNVLMQAHSEVMAALEEDQSNE